MTTQNKTPSWLEGSLLTRREQGDGADNIIQDSQELAERIGARCIEAAWLSLAEHGIFQVTLSQIAKMAHVSEAEIEARLGNLDQIRALVYRQVIEETLPLLEVDTGIKDPAAQLATRIFGLFRKAANDHLWSSLLNQFCAARHSDFILIFQDSIGRLIREGAKKGQFTVGPDQAALDMVVGGLLAGMHRLESGDVPAEQYVHDMTANILRSLGMFNRAALERALKGYLK